MSGNERAVAACRLEIKTIGNEIAPLEGIDRGEFKATKKVIEHNFKRIMKNQSA